ncbi:cholesterol 7-desaturase nvd-like [Brevipalpus obovatus]|uniref:cholesterol 7-desaturase nvd-like n=1 Tax=Brevipalpus obovatus TaxID=246614 RepID=UPI003D9EEBB5
MFSHIDYHWIKPSFNFVDIFCIAIVLVAFRWTYGVLVSCYQLFRYIAFDDIVKDFSTPERSERWKGQDFGSFPNGWIPVSESQFLEKGSVQNVQVCGQEIVLVRKLNGEVQAMDAYCPHYGANMSKGKVIRIRGEDCLRCPFHDWSFRTDDGVCVDVPYAKNRKPPEGVKIRVWKCIEIHNFIYVWHHSRGKEPTWFPNRIPEIDSGDWVYHGRSEHTVNCVLEDIPANGPDSAHLNIVHSRSVLCGGVLDENCNPLLNILHHRWEAAWEKCEPPMDHTAISWLEGVTTCFGFDLVYLSIKALQIGPTSVNLLFKSSAFGMEIKGAYIQGINPIGLNKHKIVHQLYLQRRLLSPFMSRFLLLGEAVMLERDIEIWNNKIYLKSPILVKEEKQIAQFRRFFSQFFDHERKVVDVRPDDW